MHRATITISSETIVDLAQCTLIPSGIKCEWVVGGRDPCPAVLVCWHALKQHYLSHVFVYQSKKQMKSCLCYIRKCNAQTHASLDALQKHIESSHMARTNLLCPINTCGPPRQIYRPNTLVKHFLDEHADLNGVSVPGALNPLRPLWTPFSPLKSFPAPPPLPSNSPPGCVLVISSPSIMRKKIPSSTSSVSVLPLSPFLTPRKQAQRQIPRKEQAEDVQKSDELSIPEFDDLPGFSMPESGGEHDFIVWRQPFHMDVSRPQRMVDAPLQEPPISILFDVFAKRVDELRP